MKKNKLKLYWQLFISTLKLSAFTFGGGFVIISLMKKEFVDKFKWIDEENMLNYTAIAQSSPGAIAVNASLLVGYKIGGIPGAAVTVIATVLPPLVTISIISLFYSAFKDSITVNYILKGMQAGVAAVLADVILGMVVSAWHECRWISIFLIAAAFACVAFFSVNIIFIIAVCGILGIILFSDKNSKIDHGLQK